MSSGRVSEEEDKKRKKDKKKKKKKKSKKEEGSEKKRKLDEIASASPVAPAVVPAVAPAPPPDLSKLTAEEKRKLLSAGRGARKAAYAGTEIAGPQQAKFKKFLRLPDEGSANYNPGAGTPESAATPEAGVRLEQALTSQFNKSLEYQFGGGGGGGGAKRKGLGSK